MHRNFTVEMNILNIQTTNFLLIKIYFQKKKTIQGLFATEVQWDVLILFGRRKNKNCGDIIKIENYNW